MSEPTIQLIVQQSKSEPLPCTSYYATFRGLSVFTSPKIDGERWKWLWEVANGQYAGREASALTETNVTAANKAGRLIAGMAGRAILPGEDLTALVESFKGQQFMVTVARGPQGGAAQVQVAVPPPQMG